MTIYEFFVECEEQGVRLEVPGLGLTGAIDLFRRLDDYAAVGAGRLVSRDGASSVVADLTLDDVRFLLRGVERVYVGRPRDPAQGTETPTVDALAALPADATFEASYFEM